MLFKQHDNTSPLNSTLYAMSYPQNGDHIVAVDFMTSFHLMCSLCSIVVMYFPVAVYCRLIVVQRNQSSQASTEQWMHQERSNCILQMFRMR